MTERIELLPSSLHNPAEESNNQHTFYWFEFHLQLRTYRHQVELMLQQLRHRQQRHQLDQDT
jgi:hypothetical protein